MMKAAVLAALVFFTGTSFAGAAVSSSQLPHCRQTGWSRYDGSVPYARYAKKAKRSRCRKDWTVLVYMAADNDLTPYAYWDLYEMEAGFKGGKIAAASSTSRSDLVVQLDTAGDTGLRRLHMFQANKPYNDKLELKHFRKMSDRSLFSPVVDRADEDSDQSEGSRFTDFLEWGITNYPADHYMVVVWGHGQGWGVEGPPAADGASPNANRTFGGIGFNDRTGRYLDIPSLKLAMAEVVAGPLEGRQIDIYASNACLMQMVEVANEMASMARFVVGSTRVMNFLGLPYRRLMYELNTGHFDGVEKYVDSDGKEDQAYRLAKMFPGVFRDAMAPGGLQGKLAPEAIRTVAMSAISTAVLRDQLQPALQEVGAALEAWLKEDPMRGGDLLHRLKDTLRMMGGAQELGGFLTVTRILVRDEAERDGGMSDAASKLDDALVSAQVVLSSMVLAHALGTDYDDDRQQLYLLGFKAVSMWIPQSERELASRISMFDSSEFYTAVPAWGKWLRALFAKP